jgi:putative flippase GtrA
MLRSRDLGRVLRRWLAFSSVGALGFVVQFAALLLLAGGLRVHYLAATAVAVELAILHNFLWHQRWTWSDRGTMSARHMIERLLRFNAGTAITSIGGNLVLMWVFVSLFGLHFAVANVLAVLSLSVLNFLFCDRLVFRLAPATAAKPSLAAEVSEP